MKNHPSVKCNLHITEKYSQPSVDVLAKFPQYTNIVICRYFHGIGEWQIEGLHGLVGDPIEWWPMPEIGTGISDEKRYSSLTTTSPSRINACVSKFEGITDEQLAAMPCTVNQMAILINLCQATITEMVNAHGNLQYMQATKSMSSGEDVQLNQAHVRMYEAVSRGKELIYGGAFTYGNDGPDEPDGPWAEGWAERSGKS